MRRTNFVLAIIAIALTSLYIQAQDVHNVTIKTAVIDKGLNVKNVPKFLLSVVNKDRSFAEWKVGTGFDGTATLTLPAGDYVVRSVDPLAVRGQRILLDRRIPGSPR